MAVLFRPVQRMADGFLLGEWCAARRSEYARGLLETDVAHALAEGVPGWSWNLVDTAFEINLEVLKQVRCQTARQLGRFGLFWQGWLALWCCRPPSVTLRHSFTILLRPCINHA